MNNQIIRFAPIPTTLLCASLLGGCGMLGSASTVGSNAAHSAAKDSSAPRSSPQASNSAAKAKAEPEETEEEKTARLTKEAAEASFPEDIYTMYDAKEVRAKAVEVLTTRGKEKNYGSPGKVALVTKEWLMDSRKQGNKLVQFRWVRATVQWDKEDPRGFCWHDTYDLVEDYNPASKDGWGPMYIGAVCKQASCTNGPIACN